MTRRRTRSLGARTFPLTYWIRSKGASSFRWIASPCGSTHWMPRRNTQVCRSSSSSVGPRKPWIHSGLLGIQGLGIQYVTNCVREWRVGHTHLVEHVVKWICMQKCWWQHGSVTNMGNTFDNGTLLASAKYLQIFYLSFISHCFYIAHYLCVHCICIL